MVPIALVIDQRLEIADLFVEKEYKSSGTNNNNQVSRESVSTICGHPGIRRCLPPRTDKKEFDKNSRGERTMRKFPLIVLVAVALVLPFAAHGQAVSATDALLRTVSTSAPVHFDDGSGQDLLLPSGSFYVSSDASALQLIRLEDGKTFTVAATLGTHAEELVEIVALSVSGIDEQPDVHEVLLLFVDGTQLVAAGSYSGVQARGLCGSVCKAAKARAAAAALAARREAAAAAERTRQAALLAQQRAQEAAGNIVDAVGGGIQELVSIATSLELQGLLQCLADAPGDSRLASTVEQVRNDPARYIRTVTQNLQTKISEDIPNRVQAAIQGGASDGQIVDLAINRFDAIVNNHAAASCLMGYLENQGVDWKARARGAANTAIQNAKSEAESLFNDKIIPAVTSGLAEKIGDALDATGSDSESVATALFVSELTDELKTSNATFRSALAMNVGSRNSTDISAAMARTTDFPDSLVLKFGYELLRARGHDFIDRSEAPGGEWAADQIKDVYISGMDGVNEVVGALCGLIPEVGGVICAPISYVTRIVYAKIVANIIKKKLVEFMHEQLDVAMDKGWQAIENNTDPDAVWQQAGPLGIILQGYTQDTILQIANDAIGPFRDELIEYNNNLSQIIEDYAVAN